MSSILVILSCSTEEREKREKGKERVDTGENNRTINK